MSKKTQDLVKQYVSLHQEKEKLDEKISSLKDKISAFSKSSNQKTLAFGHYILRVSQKLKVVFPKKYEKGRKELVEIVEKSSELKKALSFDIIKLANAYRTKKLSSNLTKKLTRFARQEEIVRFSLRDTKQK